MRYLIVPIITLILFPVFCLAGEEAPPPDLGNAPDAPTQVQNGENSEPEITILRSGKKIIEEYSRGGKIYMIKVIPDIGPPYYFLDDNGDGNFDVRNSDLDRATRVNMWKLLEWD